MEEKAEHFQQGIGYGISEYDEEVTIPHKRCFSSLIDTSQITIKSKLSSYNNPHLYSIRF